MKCGLDSRFWKFTHLRFEESRVGWALADAHAVLWIWFPKVLWVLVSLSIVFLYPEILPFDTAYVRQNLGNWKGVALALVSAFLPLIGAFIWVVVLRRNFTVKGVRRAFPYTRSRWL